MNNTNRFASRYTPRQPQHHVSQEASENKRSVFRYVVDALILILFIMAVVIGYHLVQNKQTLNDPELRSGLIGYCLDDHYALRVPNTAVEAWKCNGTIAQNWMVSGTHIVRPVKSSNYCLAVRANGKLQGDKIVENVCSSAQGQQWIHYMDGYQNPASGLCLDVPNASVNTQLILNTCNDMFRLSESWTPDNWQGQVADPSDLSCNKGNKGQDIACYAERQWAAWQLGATIQPALLADYTDGNANEEWCADFVSYIYKEAGYPFADGERDGWDQYTADAVQYMGFTKHAPATYLPQPGDVAYFDYPGGHVEIVVKGGAHPTFIYGDAGTIDPATNNGEMSKNSFTSDGAAGHVVYYLSPN